MGCKVVGDPLCKFVRHKVGDEGNFALEESFVELTIYKLYVYYTTQCKFSEFLVEHEWWMLRPCEMTGWMVFWGSIWTETFFRSSGAEGRRDESALEQGQPLR